MNGLPSTITERTSVFEIKLTATVVRPGVRAPSAGVQERVLDRVVRHGKADPSHHHVLSHGRVHEWIGTEQRHLAHRYRTREWYFFVFNIVVIWISG